jgi:hypothetical protein
MKGILLAASVTVLLFVGTASAQQTEETCKNGTSWGRCVLRVKTLDKEPAFP